MYYATRRIEFDAGHRVHDHESQCRNVHGHRYRVEATLKSPILVERGSETGMVLDFGIAKSIMRDSISLDADHSFIFDVNDTELLEFFVPPIHRESLRDIVSRFGHVKNHSKYKILVLDCTPTAENLARFWFNRMNKEMEILPGTSSVRATNTSLHKVRVYETPNCFADYAPAHTPTIHEYSNPAK